jgi:protein-tyrosine phosphatase
MFGIFKKKITEKESTAVFESVVTDMHSHILPGIDDGAQTTDDSINLISCLYNKGIRKFICTPHIYKELYPNTPETIQKAYETLLPVVQEKFPDIEIRYAAEYFMDDHFDMLLEQKHKLLTVADDYVLVEHSFMQVPFDLKEKLFNLQMAGYTPILAHPERYEFYMHNKKAYDTLYDIGCIFQINLLSLMGYYGKPPMELAKYLIEKKYVRLVGSDIHHPRHIEAYKQFGNSKFFQELVDQGKLLNTTIF